MYQLTTIVGNVGSDPDLRSTPSGAQVCNFSMAVNRKWTAADGQKQEKTVWFRVTAWRKTAEIVAQYVVKGRQLLVVGELDEPRVFQDKSGSWRASLDLTASSVQMLGGRGEAASGVPVPTSVPSAGSGSYSDEEIPF
jgi:single-strand DNA-binding protein